MKTAAILLMVLVLVAAGVFGYGLFNTSLQVIGKGLDTIPADQRPAEFEALKGSLERKSLLGTILKSDPLGSAGEYTYYMYTLRLHNPGLVDAEMVELQIAPVNQDVLFYGETQEVIIPAQGTRDVWCVLLTQGTPHAVREIYVTYYLWGHPHEVKFTYDNTL